MELNWIEDFIALAELESFSRAAEARHVTQPAFSRRIRALEHWIGTPLFDRATHRVQLTPAGRLLLPAAAEVVRILMQSREAAREAGSSEARTLRFAATHVLSSTFFPEWLAEIEVQTPISNVRLISDSMQGCEDVLLHGEANFLICHFHPAAPCRLDPSRFPSHPIGRDALVPAAAATLAETADMARLPQLAYSPESGLGRIVAANGGAVLSAVFMSHLAIVLRTLACNGRGVAWLPLSLIRDDLEQGRLAIVGPATARLPIEIRLFRPRARQSPQAEAIWALARARLPA